MLHFIRERAQGWVAWFIVGLISIPFALWGVNSYLGGPSDVVMATVNGEPIKQVEYQRSLQQYRDNLREQMGDNFDPAVFDSEETKQLILDQLIQRKLLLGATQTLGQQVTNRAVSQSVQQTAAFQVDGQFSLERYKALLARVGFSPASYEAQVRSDLLSQELTQNIQRTAVVANSDIDQLLMIEKQQREIAYGVISADSYFEDIVVTDAEVQDYYETNQGLYTTPERVAVDYVELLLSDVMTQVDVDEDSLMAFYEENQAQFMLAEQRRASHILIEGDAEVAKKILAAAQHRITQGEDFALVAKELSQDPGSASDGGDLGFLQAGVMEDQAFDDALFGLLAVGDVSAIVETEFGHHLIQLTEIKAGTSKPFEEVRTEVEDNYRRQEAQSLFFEQTELLAELSYENPDSLDLVAEELGLEIKSTDLFDRSGGAEGVAANNKVVNTAFSDDVLVEGLNSSVIEIAENHVVVVNKKTHQLPGQLTVEEVKDQIQSTLTIEKAEQQAVSAGEAIIEQISAGTDPSSLFAQGAWFEKALVSRNQPGMAYDIMDEVYAIQKPAGETVYHGFTIQNGDYIVVALSNVVEGDISAVTEQDKTGLSAYLANRQGDAELRAFLESLKADADIQIKSSL